MDYYIKSIFNQTMNFVSNAYDSLALLNGTKILKFLNDAFNNYIFPTVNCVGDLSIRKIYNDYLMPGFNWAIDLTPSQAYNDYLFPTAGKILNFSTSAYGDYIVPAGSKALSFSFEAYHNYLIPGADYVKNSLFNSQERNEEIRAKYNKLVTEWYQQHFAPVYREIHKNNQSISSVVANEAMNFRNKIKMEVREENTFLERSGLALRDYWGQLTSSGKSKKTSEDLAYSAFKTGGQDLGLKNNGFETGHITLSTATRLRNFQYILLGS